VRGVGVGAEHVVQVVFPVGFQAVQEGTLDRDGVALVRGEVDFRRQGEAPLTVRLRKVAVSNEGRGIYIYPTSVVTDSISDFQALR
jgi:hypothetical protein